MIRQIQFGPCSAAQIQLPFSRRSHLRLSPFGLFEASSSVQGRQVVCPLVELQRASLFPCAARQPLQNDSVMRCISTRIRLDSHF